MIPEARNTAVDLSVVRAVNDIVKRNNTALFYEVSIILVILFGHPVAVISIDEKHVGLDTI
jgi:hypothetical protein